MLKNRAKPLTKAQRDKLNPDQIIKNLGYSNSQFAKDQGAYYNYKSRIKTASKEQFPEAIVLSCHDSRIAVEDIFQRGVGDIFVVRIAGNVTNTDVLASLEYGCCVMGAKVVIVMGHNNCGAVVSAIQQVHTGNIGKLIKRIEPSIELAKSQFVGINGVQNPDFVDLVCRLNVKNSINEIRSKSPSLHQMEQRGDIKIVGSIYDMTSGKVEFLDI